MIETNYGLVKEVIKPFASIEDFMENIDATVTCAKNEIAKWNAFKKLFDSQIATLIERGVPRNIVGLYNGQKEVVLKHAMETTFGKGNIPFFPVIQLKYRTIFDLMAMELMRKSAIRTQTFQLPIQYQNRLYTFLM